MLALKTNQSINFCFICNLQNCSVNPSSSILARVVKMKELFVREYVGLTNDNHTSVAHQRFLLGQRLYYRVMEAMLNYVSV